MAEAKTMSTIAGVIKVLQQAELRG